MTASSLRPYVAGRERNQPQDRIARLMSVLCVLPARIASQRIPGKPLQMLAGRPLIEWSWRAACAVPGVDAVRVATDDEEIASRVRAFGGAAVLTAATHPSGTDRVAEVARSPEGREFDVIVNFQADEPFLPPEHAEAAIGPVAEGAADIATLATPFATADAWNSAAEVKVARAVDGRALYFSRAGIPWSEAGTPDFDAGDAGAGPSGPWLRHLGLYVYTRAALESWVTLPPSPLELVERLEQLRPLEAGHRVYVAVVGPCPGAIEEPEDLVWAEALLRTRNADSK